MTDDLQRADEGSGQVEPVASLGPPTDDDLLLLELFVTHAGVMSVPFAKATTRWGWDLEHTEDVALRLGQLGMVDYVKGIGGRPIPKVTPKGMAAAQVSGRVHPIYFKEHPTREEFMQALGLYE